MPLKNSVKINMSKLYPLTFDPIYKEKIWGGNKINTVLEKDFGNIDNCGESWELSGVEGDESVVSNGDLKGQSLPELINTFKGKLVGESVFERFGNEFPLLIKFLDAQQDLSIQVHPDDLLAKEKHNGFGKTEMWYILDADEGSHVISGFNTELTKKEFSEKINSGNLESVLNYEKAAPGDVFFIPAGRIHTTGKGLLLAEVQQTSDTTYRVYDFDRIDKKGNKRDLHIEDALEALDFKVQESYRTEYENSDEVNLVTCPYFSTSRIRVSDNLVRDYSNNDSFVILMNVGTQITLKVDGADYNISKGQTFLIPAVFDTVELTGAEGELLEITVNHG